ncbi:hypothetical protein ACTWP5_27495 [Streptomyces sp. 4N509B]|uniref:hypothetical protein n=1 Tax=Streptomyces sp. 4N509B TaxID=3457413 RepID=UPI003FD3C760
MTDDPERFEVRDETGRIGALYYARPDEEDPAEGWVVELGGFELGGSKQTDYHPSVAEAVDAARLLYDELLDYRRRMARVQGWVRVVSIPMGGQPR